MGAGHAHGAGGTTAGHERRVLWALCLTVGYMGVQAAAGVYAGSLALLADAAHMLTDAVALALTYAAFRFGRRPPDRRRTYGYHRFQVLAAFVNGLALFLIAGAIVWEAIHRIQTPEPVEGGIMLVAAGIGLVINIVAFAILQSGGSGNLNMRGAIQHVMGDLLGSIGAILAGGIIVLTGWTLADPLLSVLVCLLVLYNAGKLVRDSTHVLLEGAPADLDLDAMGKAIEASVPGVVRAHHIHAWMLTPERVLVTMHLETTSDAPTRAVLAATQKLLHDRFEVEHATIQIEPAAA